MTDLMVEALVKKWTSEEGEEELRADLMALSTEVERLNRQIIEQEHQIQAWHEKACKAEAQIEAVLAIARRLKEQDQPMAGLGVSLEKTLTGGRRRG